MTLMSNHIKISLLTLLFIVLPFSVFSQITGKVVNENNQPLEMVDIIVKNTNKGTITNQQGEFSINIKDGNYTVVASFVGFKTIIKKVNINNGIAKRLYFKLIEDKILLDDIVIKAKTKSQIVREQSYAVEAVEMKELKNISTDVGAVIGKVSGVNLRQSGGLGSDSKLSLNGFYGNQVRVFIDGIPMSYFGTSLNLNNFPSNLVDQIEVYKGVVPIHLSSDALGGAINVITNSKHKNFLDVSYGYGSFNTNRIAVNGLYRLNSGFTFRVKSFYNYSDNDYKVPVTINQKTKWYRRFHDAYNSKMFWAEFGFTDIKFADELMIGSLLSSNFNEIQQMPSSLGQAITPFGEIFTEEEKIIYNLSYKKKNLLPNLATSMYLVAVNSDVLINDTSDYNYDWNGNKTLRNLNSSTGESGYSKMKFNLNKKNYLANINNEYAFNDANNIAMNYSLNKLKLQGSDKYKKTNNVRFKAPSDLTKQVVSFSYTNKFKNLKSSVFGKYYAYNLSSIDTDFSGFFTDKIEKSFDYYGYGATISYELGNLQLKTSYENCLRFPEVVEIFGNGLEVIPNPNLKPETSQNINLGLLYNLELNQHKILTSINSFYRKGKDYIYPNIGVFIEYINAIEALTKGIDISLNYNYKGMFLLNFNGSYYKKVNSAEWENKAKKRKNLFYNVRFPNEPYLFGNVVASYRKRDLLADKDALTLSVRYNYVHKFFYNWSNLGKYNKKFVPTQQTTDLELVYGLQNNTYNFSFGVKNIFNKMVYDNFNQVKPRRTLNFKLRYFIN